MKKPILYFLLAFISIGVKAQNYDWQVLSTGGTGLFTSLSNTYSLTYFKGGEISNGVNIGPRIYVATREGAQIDVLNAADGAFVKGIATAGSGYKNTKIRATETGEIYSVAMKLGGAGVSDGQVITVGYLADENSPLQTLTFPYPTGFTPHPRMGDSFDLAGSGNNTVFFIGGSGSSFIYVFKRNGGSVDFVRSINLGGDIAAFSISIIPNESNLSNSDFLVSHNTTSTARKIFKYDSGTDSYSAITLPTIIHDLSVLNNFSQLKYFNINGQGYLAATGGSTDPSSKNIRIFKVLGTNYSVNANFALVKTLNGGNYTYVTGNGGFSDLAFANTVVEAGDFVGGKYDFKLYQLVTRNAISAYTIGFNADGTLPVSLSSFNAALVNGTSKLSWSTTSESNNNGFEIQRSVDGKDFVTLDFVVSKADQGNSLALISYTFEDKNAVSGTQYYRLKQIDLNGHFNYSEIESVNMGLSEVQVKIYPNPVKSTLVLALPADLKEATYLVYSFLGKEMFGGRVEETTEIPVAELAPATYFIKISNKGKEIKSLKFIKQ